jgi:hypothetical protein
MLIVYRSYTNRILTKLLTIYYIILIYYIVKYGEFISGEFSGWIHIVNFLIIHVVIDFNGNHHKTFGWILRKLWTCNEHLK